MECKKCGRSIQDGSAFCNWCGAKQIKPKRGNAEISVPKARQLSSGTWFIQLRLGGDSISVTADTERQCRAKALMIKTEHMNGKRDGKTQNVTLRQCCQKYIDDHRATLSPSTVRGYNIIKNNRFPDIMDTKVDKISNWQLVINNELKAVSLKTTKNSFGFVCTALKYSGCSVPSVKFPQAAKPDTKWLNYEQVLQFCEAIKGEKCELGALLALHSLRRSELMALTGDKIDKVNKTITVRGSVVQGENNKFVRKEVNKTSASQRVIPFMIPRLEEVLPDAEADEPLVKCEPNTLFRQINRVCEKAGLPLVGVHGLRRSFASLAYHIGWTERVTMSIGGWDDVTTMHKMYVKLAENDKIEAANEMLDFYTNAN